MGYKDIFKLKNRGFTLIELLVAISIVAILSTIGLVVYTNVQKTARDAKRTADIKEIQKGMEQYYSLNRSYPAALSGLPASIFQASTAPVDPTGAAYYYGKCSSVEKYIVCADVENNSQGNRDSLPSDPCIDSVTGGGTNYYCAGSLSN